MLYNQNKGFENIQKLANNTLEITNATNVNLLEQREVLNKMKTDVRKFLI